jgi:hypothetical protein
MNVDFLKDVALAVAQEQHLETVMKMIVEGIKEEPDVALVRTPPRSFSSRISN